MAGTHLVLLFPVEQLDVVAERAVRRYVSRHTEGAVRILGRTRQPRALAHAHRLDASLQSVDHSSGVELEGEGLLGSLLLEDGAVGKGASVRHVHQRSPVGRR